jgi:hypothetical protein
MSFNFAAKDKKALLVLGFVIALYTTLQFAGLPLWDALQERGDNLPVVERKLEKYRAVARTAELSRAEAASVETKLQEAEKGLLASKTPALASAELQQIANQLTAAESIDIRSNQFLPVKPVGNEYIHIPVVLQFQCRLDQLVNLLTDVSAHQKRLAVSNLYIQALGGKDKQLTVAMELSGFMRAEAPKTSGSERNAQRTD